MKRLYLIFALAVVSFVPTFSSAQSFQNLGGGQSNAQINVSVVPSQPRANQFVNISVESYATDLDLAEISWIINNKLEKKAVGTKTFLIKTGALGSVTNILIIIKTDGGEVIQRSLNIHPGDMDLIWEAQSYTPPFYKGKALFPYQGTVKVVAVPSIINENGEKINPKNLVYTWKIDGGVVNSVSGYGRNSMSFNGSVPISPASVEVEASSLDKNYSAVGFTTITPQGPSILFYEDSPVFGVLYNKNIEGNVTLKEQEMRVASIPYFVGVKEKEGRGLFYEWRLNNEIVTGSSGKSSLSFRQEKDTSGTSNISLQVTNPARIFQFANNGLSLTFGQNTSGGLFGTQ